MMVMAKPLEIIECCHFELRTLQRHRKFLADRVRDTNVCLLLNALGNHGEVKHDRVVAERGASTPCRTGKPQKPICPRGTGC